MELNRAQLLVHNDAAMERFRATYCIPTDVIIDHPRSNEVPVVNLDNVVGSSELGMTVFDHSRGTRVACPIILMTSLKSILNSAKRPSKLLTTGKSLGTRRGRMVSVVELEDTVLPISISSSDNEHSNDLANARPPSMREVENVGPSSIIVDIMRFKNLKKKTMSAADPILNSLEAPLLDKRKGKEFSVGYHVAKRCHRPLQRDLRDHGNFVNDAACSGKNHDIDNFDIAYLILIFFPVLLVLESSKSDGDLKLHEQVQDSSYVAATQAQNKAANAEAILAQLQAVAYGPVYERVFNKGVSQVTEVHSESFLEGWIACLAELDIPKDNPTWTKDALALEFPEFLAPYLLMILPSFDEEEYMNKPEDDEDVPDLIPDLVMAPSNEAATLTEEVGGMIDEAFGEKFVEKTEGDDGEDVVRDPPLEL
ncbi:hypothetical protein Acr_14g0006300 [Actinidia rufa]|uniref:Uncharacterized protein n=1 Tax=Actinidia rufa TaxID=165716 RepID=A0A7J0FQK1_9ERIC|nr:hypothetical protein Acr_14g0006300 [Actinidia rufa]